MLWIQSKAIYTNASFKSVDTAWCEHSPEDVQERAPLKHLVCFTSTTPQIYQTLSTDNILQRDEASGQGVTRSIRWWVWTVNLRWSFMKLYKLKKNQTYDTCQRERARAHVFRKKRHELEKDKILTQRIFDTFTYQSGVKEIYFSGLNNWTSVFSGQFRAVLSSKKAGPLVHWFFLDGL